MAKIKDCLHDAGMLITVSGMHGNVLRLQPPLSITSAQIDQFLAALRKTLADGPRGLIGRAVDRWRSSWTAPEVR